MLSVAALLNFAAGMGGDQIQVQRASASSHADDVAREELPLASPNKGSMLGRRGAEGAGGARGKASASFAEVLGSKKEGSNAPSGVLIPTGKIQVKVIFIRHGHACHNALGKQGSSNTLSNKWHESLYLDPPLTNCGVRLSEANGASLRNAIGETPTFVGTSGLIRAIESGLAMFPDAARVSPLPFISEEGIWSCNTPSHVSEQQEHFKNTDPTGAARLDWRYIKAFKKKDRGAADYKKFKDFLADTVLPDLVADFPGSNLTLAIVSHSHFLTTTFEKAFGRTGKERRFENNAAKSVTYTYTFRSRRDESKIQSVTLQEDKNSYAVVGDAPVLWPPPQKDKAGYLCQKDYNRCSVVNPKKMGLTQEEAAAKSSSPFINHQQDGDECCTDMSMNDLGKQSPWE